jgi:hypothetical protein
VRWTFFQSREYQSTVVLGTAPAGVATADMSASPPQVGWPRFSRDGTLEGSQPAMSVPATSSSLAGLRVGVMSLVGPTQLLSGPLQAGVRLLPHPRPAAPWAFLANTLSRPIGVWGRRTAGLDSFTFMTVQGEGRASGPVVQRPWQGSACPLAPDHSPFWFKPVSSLCILSWLVEHHGPLTALQLGLALCPAFLAPDRPALLAVAVSAHAFTTVPCGKRAHCPAGFRHRCLPR